MAITVTSRGNKGTENVILRLKTASVIENYEVTPAGLSITHTGNELTTESTRLNSSQQLKLFLRCSGNPSQSQIDELNISHSEGAGINEHEIQTIKFSFAGIELEYDPKNLRTRLMKIGPISIR